MGREDTRDLFVGLVFSDIGTEEVVAGSLGRLCGLLFEGGMVMALASV
jgi:hypothetical protein